MKEVGKLNDIHVPNKYEAYLMSDQFDKIRQSVLSRDNHKCVVCGSQDNLQVHHLTYENIYKEDIGDLITLCGSCHSIYHAIDNRRKAVEEYYSKIKIQGINDFEARAQEWKEQREKEDRESILITKEIKEEYLKMDYCKNGDLDMCAWDVLNTIIDKKCKEHDIETWMGDKTKLRSWFLYRRLEFLLRCLDQGFTLYQIESKTKFDMPFLKKWYRKDKCKAKLNEELILKED